MLTSVELSGLERMLRDERVLSVYLDGTAEDFAAQRIWRVALAHAMKDIRSWLSDSSHAERTTFEQCAASLDELLPQFAAGIGAPGWAAFIAADGVRYAERLPVPMPTLAVWSTGACVAPYVRALKQTRPVIVVLADARKAILHRYHEGELERIETLHADTALETFPHMGEAPRSGFHHGVHGTTGHDAAQRALVEETSRMLRATCDKVLRFAGTEGWILIGGIPRVGRQLEQMLGRAATQRLLQLDSLDIHASDAEVAEAARRGASALRDASHLRRLTDLVEQGRGKGLAALGPAEARQALAQRCVRELYLTHRYLDEHTPDAEEAVRLALQQNAAVEEVERDAARWLDEHGGMAALLRYVIPGGSAVGYPAEPAIAPEPARSGTG